MNESDVQELVFEYVTGHLCAEREAELKALLTEHGSTIEELDELREYQTRYPDLSFYPDRIF